MLLSSFLVTCVICFELPVVAAASNHHIIKVPLHRRLIDVLSDAKTKTPSSPSRKYEVEFESLDNDGTERTTSLLLDEIEDMAITSRTTFNFQSHGEFSLDHIQNVVVLASRGDDRGVNGGGLTIISANKASGNVHGIQHADGIKMISSNPTDDNKKLILQTIPSTNEDQRRLHEKMANWTCGAEHIHGSIDNEMEDLQYNRHQHHRSRTLQDKSEIQNSTNVRYEYSNARSANSPNTAATTWIPPTTYSFHIPLYIEIDATFIIRQGGRNQAIEYVNFLTSAVNIIIEHELDAHLEVVHVEETDIYDNITTTKDALRTQRLRPRDNLAGSNYYGQDGDDKIILVHALLGRHVGGGIAYIDTICDRKWAFGITSDVHGSFTNLGADALLDLFYYAHEIGHSLGSGHTFDSYEPAVDTCGAVCTLGEEYKSDPAGLPLHHSATLMSYCNFCTGGIDNVAFTYGGLFDGKGPRSDINSWVNHPDIAGIGTVSVEPKRVSYTIWNLLSDKVTECIEPPYPSQELQRCNDSSDCDDTNMCTIDVCSSPDNVCSVYETLGNCCGNNVCEQGEVSANCSDCGPFVIKPSTPCEDCHALDGFVLEVGVNKNANQAVSLTSISLQHKAPQQLGSYVEVFIARSSSVGVDTKLNSAFWQGVNAASFSDRKGMIEISFPSPVVVDIAGKVEIYIAASEELLQFGVGAYSIENEHGVQLHSGRAVSGRFGTETQSFSLNCEIKYRLTSIHQVSVEEFRIDRGSASSSVSESTEEAFTDSSLVSTSSEMDSTVSIWIDEVSAASVRMSTVYSAPVVTMLVLLNLL